MLLRIILIIPAQSIKSKPSTHIEEQENEEREHGIIIKETGHNEKRYTEGQNTHFLTYKLKDKCLEALAVDDTGAGLVVLLLGDPHGGEGGERREDGATNPNGVLTFGGSNDLDLHGRGSKVLELLLETLADAREHRGTTGEDNVAVEILTDIDIALHDGVVGGLSNTDGLEADERRLEENLRAAETLVADGDDLTVRKLVGLLNSGRRGGDAHLLVEVESDVRKLLLDVTNDFTLGSGGERVTALGEDLHEVVGEITSGKIDTEDSVGKSVT